MAVPPQKWPSGPGGGQAGGPLSSQGGLGDPWPHRAAGGAQCSPRAPLAPRVPADASGGRHGGHAEPAHSPAMGEETCGKTAGMRPGRVSCGDFSQPKEEKDMRSHPARLVPDSQPSLGAQAAPEKGGFVRGHGGRHTGPAAPWQAVAWRRALTLPRPCRGSPALQPPGQSQERGALANAVLPGRQRGDCGWAAALSATIVLTGKGQGRLSWHGSPGPRSQCETPPVGIYPGMGCYRHHQGQQMARRDGEGGPILQSPMSK